MDSKAGTGSKLACLVVELDVILVALNLIWKITTYLGPGSEYVSVHILAVLGDCHRYFRFELPVGFVGGGSSARRELTNVLFI